MADAGFYDVYLKSLRETNEFQNLIKRVKTQRPIVPVYDANDDNTEIWKANCYMLKGFDLCLTLLGERDG